MKLRRLAQWLVPFAGVAFVYRDVFLGRVLAGKDAFRFFLPAAVFLDRTLRDGHWPLWIPHERLGAPFAATVQTQVFYPLRLLPLFLLGPYRATTVEHLLHVGIAIAGVALLCRRLGASRFAATFAGCAFGLSHLISTLSAIPNVAGAASWAGLILLAARGVALRPSARAAALLAFPIALCLMVGSLEQLAWQSMLAVAAVAVWARQRPRALACALGGVALGLALAGVVVVPAAELLRWSTRAAGAEGALAWSVPPAQLISMAWPIAAEPRTPYGTGGDQWLFPSLFVGATVFALAIGALRRRRTPLLFAGGAAFFLLLALGEHFLPSALLLRVPPLSFFRFPVKYAVGAAFCACVLASLGFDRLRALHRRARLRRWLPLAFSAGAFAVLGLASLAMRSGARVGVVWLGFVLLGGAAAFTFIRADRGRALGFAIASLAAFEGVAAHLLFEPVATAPVETLARPSALAAHVGPDQRFSVVEPAGWKTGAFHYREFVDQSREMLVPLRFVEDGVDAFEGYAQPCRARSGRWRTTRPARSTT